MLTSYFGRYQAFYMFPGQYQTMGRTYGPDLIIPNIPRQYAFNQPEQHIAHYQQHLLQQQQQFQQQRQEQQHTDVDEDVLNSEDDDEHIDYDGEIRGPGHRLRRGRSGSAEKEHNENQEIKFSIERILSDDCDKTKDTAVVKIEENDETEVEGDLNAENNDEVDEAMRYEWLQCTRYKPPKLQRSRKKENAKKRKLGRNPRVPFTQHQVSGLERKFGLTHYLSSMDVAELSSALNLTETRVKIWFQNRRARERRNHNVKHTRSTTTEQQNDCKFLFAPNSSGQGGVTSRSFTELHEALQNCSAFTPLSFRHNTKGT